MRPPTIYGYYTTPIQPKQADSCLEMAVGVYKSCTDKKATEMVAISFPVDMQGFLAELRTPNRGKTIATANHSLIPAETVPLTSMPPKCPRFGRAGHGQQDCCECDGILNDTTPDFSGAWSASDLPVDKRGRRDSNPQPPDRQSGSRASHLAIGQRLAANRRGRMSSGMLSRPRFCLLPLVRTVRPDPSGHHCDDRIGRTARKVRPPGRASDGQKLSGIRRAGFTNSCTKNSQRPRIIPVRRFEACVHITRFVNGDSS
jgi:hypothetical protein